jgi:hypothetical protein
MLILEGVLKKHLLLSEVREAERSFSLMSRILTWQKDLETSKAIDPWCLVR